MPTECPACPSCQSTEDVFPVSRIYIAGITHPTHRSEADWAILRAVYGDTHARMKDFGQHFRRFNPPSSEPDGLRPLHPDMAAVMTAVFIVVLVGNVYAAIRQLWTTPLGLGAILGFMYLLSRRRLLGHYRAVQESRKIDWHSLTSELARWRRFYYCARDELQFEMDEQAARSVLSQNSAQPFVRS